MEDKKKILIIDDSPHIQEPLKEILLSEGYEVFSAFDAKEGLDVAGRCQPDLIILDVMLPTGSGLNVYDDLKRITAAKHPTIIIYSSAPSALIAEKDPDLDRSNIVSKGTDVPELLDIIEKRIGPRD
jgi:DNA-binding response OmpR family regulator